MLRNIFFYFALLKKMCTFASVILNTIFMP